MKLRMLLLALLIAFTFDLEAGWLQIGENERLVTYVDTTTRTNGKNVVVWVLFDYKKVQESPRSGKQYSSEKAQYELDLTAEKARVLFFSWHAARMGDGVVVYNGNKPNAWMPTSSPDSIASVLWKYIRGGLTAPGSANTKPILPKTDANQTVEQIAAKTTDEISVGSTAGAQAPPVKSSIAQDLGKTFGFCYGQRLSLTQLRQMFPDLDPQIMLAEMQWNSAFKEAEEGVEARLKAFGPDEWADTRTKMIAQFEPILKKQNSKATREIATNFLKVLQQRAKGVLDSPIREMLLASHPKFVKSPELEFATGYTGTFSSKGHSKAKGVELTVKYPLSWKQLEADRPNIVQKWTSDGGHGTDIFMVQVRKFPALPTPQESAELFTESFAHELFEDGGKTLSYTTGRLEKLPLGIVHFTQTTKRLDLTIDTRGVFYYLIHEDALIFLQFMCYTPGGAEAKEARIKQLEPLIKSIVNSLVLPTNYK